MAGFKGFSFTSPEEVIANTRANFQKAMSSGDVNAMRMAIAQNAGFTLGGSAELAKARKKKQILNDSLKASQESSTGDEMLDEMNFYKRAAKAAADAGLPDIAIQATERLTSLAMAKEQRDMLRTEASREEWRFQEEQEDATEADVKERLGRRTKVAQIGVNAYQDSIANGADETTAEQNARKAQLSYFAAMSEEGTLHSGTVLARDQGFDLSEPYSFQEEQALAKDTTRELKSLTTIMQNGRPKLAYVVQGPNGPEIIPSQYDDADALLAARKDAAGGSNVTDAERKNAAFALNMMQAQEVFAELDWTDADFTTIGNTIESSLPNRIRGPELQRFEQAKETYINAKLRRESGATIKDEEYFRAEKAMFPQAGDTPDVVRQKRRMRQAELAGIQAAAGDQALGEALLQFQRVQMQDEKARELYEMGL